MDEPDDYRRKDDEISKKSPIGSKGGSVDEKVCHLCGVFHPPVFWLRKDDEPLVEIFRPNCPKFYNVPAIVTVCALTRRVAMKDACCQEIGEHSVRFMLTQGANWVHTHHNQRAKVSISSSSSSSPTTSNSNSISSSSISSSSFGSSSSKDSKREITEMPATDITTLVEMKPIDLSPEPMMQRFCKLLQKEETSKRAGLNALWFTSLNNLKALREITLNTFESTEKDRRMALFNLLMSFDLSVTHYADKPRAVPIPSKEKGPPKCMMSLYSRMLLDKHSKDLGIQGYSKGNTPNMAFKNVGHVDFVFFAIEPRDAGPITKPFKAGSRFGGFCHMLDIGQLPYFSIMTLGDLDTCNAKIGENRLSSGTGGTAEALGFTRANVQNLIEMGKCKPMTTNVKMSEDGKTELAPARKIWVREFKTMSEQIFVGPHIKEALALKVLYDCMQFGFLGYGYTDVNPTAGDYNCLINGLYVPQIMVPHAFCSDQVLIFEGEHTL